MPFHSFRLIEQHRSTYRAFATGTNSLHRKWNEMWRNFSLPLCSCIDPLFICRNWLVNRTNLLNKSNRMKPPTIAPFPFSQPFTIGARPPTTLSLLAILVAFVSDLFVASLNNCWLFYYKFIHLLLFYHRGIGIGSERKRRICFFHEPLRWTRWRRREA